mgnify:CR=1 FL=1
MIQVNDNFLRLKESYLFTEIVNRTSAYQQAHPQAEVLKLGVGDVTGPLASVIIEAMHRAVDDLATTERFHGYGLENGPEWLRAAVIKTDYAPKGIAFTPDEIFISDGAGSDLGNLPEILGHDNLVAITDPVYPAYVDTQMMAGRRIILLPCRPANQFCPALPDEVPAILYLCSPNNPTGTAMTREQLKCFVDYARAHHSVILFDGAYEAFIQSEDVPHSIYEIAGAKECAIEIRSFSKSAGFTGVRCGYTVVPKELKAQASDGTMVALNPIWLRRVCTKYNGTSYIAERGAEAALTPEGIRQTRAQIAVYHRNAQAIGAGLRALGYEVYGGVDSPYLWIRTPDKMGSWEFFDYLLNEIQVVCTPGAGFGQEGEGFVRFSAFGDPKMIQKAVERIKSLKKV